MISFRILTVATDKADIVMRTSKPTRRLYVRQISLSIHIEKIANIKSCFETTHANDSQLSLNNFNLNRSNFNPIQPKPN